MMPETDILADLLEAAGSIEGTPPGELQALLLRAVETIETLRQIVDACDEIDLEQEPLLGAHSAQQPPKI